MLYKKKQQLLNSHILHLTFSLVGTVDSGKESSVIPNKKAFEDILCDLEVGFKTGYRTILQYLIKIPFKWYSVARGLMCLPKVPTHVSLCSACRLVVADSFPHLENACMLKGSSTSWSNWAFDYTKFIDPSLYDSLLAAVWYRDALGPLSPEHNLCI